MRTAPGPLAARLGSFCLSTARYASCERPFGSTGRQWPFTRSRGPGCMNSASASIASVRAAGGSAGLRAISASAVASAGLPLRTHAFTTRRTSGITLVSPV